MTVIIVSKGGHCMVGELLGYFKAAEHHTGSFPFIRVHDGVLMFMGGAILPHSDLLWDLLHSIKSEHRAVFCSELSADFGRMLRMSNTVGVWDDSYAQKT